MGRPAILHDCVMFCGFSSPLFWPIWGMRARPPDGILFQRTPPRPRIMTKSFSVFGSSSRPLLGPFEQQLLEELWQRGSATVRELIADGTIRQAYTTVMTTVDRLYKKGLLDRIAEGRAFRYTPRQSPEELQRTAALDGIRQLLGSGDTSSLPLSYLVEALSSHDAQLLDELQLLVEQKRRELKSKTANGKEQR